MDFSAIIYPIVMVFIFIGNLWTFIISILNVIGFISWCCHHHLCCCFDWDLNYFIRFLLLGTCLLVDIVMRLIVCSYGYFDYGYSYGCLNLCFVCKNYGFDLDFDSDCYDWYLISNNQTIFSMNFLISSYNCTRIRLLLLIRYERDHRNFYLVFNYLCLPCLFLFLFLCWMLLMLNLDYF